MQSRRYTWRTTGGVTFLTSDETQFKFGFTDSSIGSDPKNSFKAALGGDLLLLKQVHGNLIRSTSEAAEADLEGDGFVTKLSPADRGSSFSRAPIGIQTADCAPVIIECRDLLFLLHVGWRGLAAGIIEEAIKSLPLGPVTIRIGPCARWCCYEVKHDVISALAERAVLRESQEKTMLCMARSVSKTVELALSSRNHPGPLEIVDTDLCTICSDRLNSYRRQKKSAERNLTFVWI